MKSKILALIIPLVSFSYVFPYAGESQNTDEIRQLYGLDEDSSVRTIERVQNNRILSPSACGQRGAEVVENHFEQIQASAARKRQKKKAGERKRGRGKKDEGLTLPGSKRAKRSTSSWRSRFDAICSGNFPEKVNLLTLFKAVANDSSASQSDLFYHQLLVMIQVRPDMRAQLEMLAKKEVKSPGGFASGIHSAWFEAVTRKNEISVAQAVAQAVFSKDTTEEVLFDWYCKKQVIQDFVLNSECEAAREECVNKIGGAAHFTPMRKAPSSFELVVLGRLEELKSHLCTTTPFALEEEVLENNALGLLLIMLLSLENSLQEICDHTRNSEHSCVAARPRNAEQVLSLITEFITLHNEDETLSAFHKALVRGSCNFGLD